MPIIKGDAKSLSIAAASIVAKVTRDRLMREYDRSCPSMDLLPTRATDQKNILRLCASPGLPRSTERHLSEMSSGRDREKKWRGFLKENRLYYETQAAVFLEKTGVSDPGKEFRCPAGEIDLIAKEGEYLCFVEVKYRSEKRDRDSRGSGRCKKAETYFQGCPILSYEEGAWGYNSLPF